MDYSEYVADTTYLSAQDPGSAVGTPRSVTVVVTRLLERILHRFVTRGALFLVHRSVVTAC